MRWTVAQKEALMYKGLGKVIYKNMWKRDHQLGYGNKGSNTKYNVVIAKDSPSVEVRGIVTLHEVGHIIYKHLDVDVKEEFQSIKALCDKLKKPYELLTVYGGPMAFLNIAMDLEVNSKLLTLGNIKAMKNANVEPCTPEAYEIEVLDSFRDYYEPLIAKLDENQKMSFKMSEDISDLPTLLKQALKGQGGKNLIKEVFGDLFQDPKMPEIVEDSRDEAKAKDINSLAAGTGDSSEDTEVKRDVDILIADFIKQAVRKPWGMYVNDVLRLHNRGTRVNDQGILYSSKKRRNISQPRFCFILDVSGSMNVDPIMKALGTLDQFFRDTSRNSKIITWAEDLKEEFDIDRIPSSVKIGGGTNMAAAVDYAKQKGFTDCVIYSDFYTDLEKLQEASQGINVFSICVDSSDSNPLKDSDFYKAHSKALFLEEE